MIRILFNALGIQDSGGISVLVKTLNELNHSRRHKVYIFLYRNSNTSSVVDHFEQSSNLNFVYVYNRNLFIRMLYENFYFLYFSRINRINLVYNFSGSAQIFNRKIQLIKIQNILFYSKQLDKTYFNKKQYLKWVKTVFVKRILLFPMLKLTQYVEIQSDHVKSNICDYLDLKNKTLFVKSDFQVTKMALSNPKVYNRSQKLTILFIVGPHYALLHKNIDDFNRAMLELIKYDINFEIKITLTREELNSCSSWNNTLDSRTKYLGYVKRENISELFQDNSILISTSIIETLGLHVIEAIIHGIITIVPRLDYSECVYGFDVRKYELFDPKSLCSAIIQILNMKDNKVKEIIKKNQDYLYYNEQKKHDNILEVIDLIQKENNQVSNENY